MDYKQILKETLAIKFDKAFGLDIGDRSVEIVEMNKFLRFSVTTYGRADLPEGVVEDGRILNPGVLVEKIKTLLKEATPKKVSTNKVIISLPDSQIFMQSFEVNANLRDGALVGDIRDRVALLMPVNIDKTYWDFTEKLLPDNTKKLIMFFSVPKEVANSYVKLCNSIGLEVVSLCTESLSLARVILRPSDRQSLIIDIGAGATNLSFFNSNDMLEVALTIPVAGSYMTSEIKQKLKVDNTEAEALKIKFGLTENKENTVRPILLPIIEGVLKETNKAIAYYEQVFMRTLDDVYVIGGSVLMPGLIDMLNTGLKREVKVASSSSILNLKLLTDKSDYFPLYANVIGLGMLGTSIEFRDMDLLKRIPASEVNSINKLNLFNMGYLSRINAFRTLINNRTVLISLIVIIGVIFTVLLNQANKSDFTNSFVIVPAPVVTRSILLPRIISTSTNPAITSTTTSVSKTSATQSSTTSTNRNYVINDNYVFTTDENPGVYSEAVANMQNRLIKTGYFNGVPGGFFGPATSAALKVYQKAKGLTETGILDAPTRAKLNVK